jgi:hypothetical protein
MSGEWVVGRWMQGKMDTLRIRLTSGFSSKMEL